MTTPNLRANSALESSIFLFSIFSLTSVSYGQTNTLPATGNVGIGTTNPTTKLQVNGSARIDSALVVKDSVRINKSLRVDQDVRFLGETKMNQVKVTDEFIVNGLSKLNGDIKFPNVPLVTNYSELTFLTMNQNGLLKKATGDEFADALKSIVYGTPTSGVPVGICDLVGFTPTWANGPQKLFVECPNVNVGIGTSTPSHNLTVVGASKFGSTVFVEKALSIGTDINSFSKFNILNVNRTASIQVKASGNGQPYQRLMFFEYDNPDTKIMEVINTATNRTPFVLRADGQMDIDNGTGQIFHLGANGMLAISNGTTETFRVEANGMTRARKIKVDTQVWPDYVFESSYELMPLREVESFLKENKHLPAIPSQEEMKKEGIDLAEMNVKMMEKIEELTLYLIQQNKELEKVKAELEILKQQKP
ncbi:hypothetical protein [Fluviicola sp.]|uniref:hypothetical protein n=1 Tax=Fluviicola sp. TaxID=1917219 RepID=UPI003D290397